MSVDPVLAGAIANVEALIDAELAALAADAESLGSTLTAGQVVSAKVLPSNGLTDLLDINGLRVSAALPPTLRPGDVIAVKVTGFDGSRILLQLLDTTSGSGATPAPNGGSAPAATAGQPPTSASATGQNGPSATGASLAPGVTAGRVAPPTAVFVAASVRPASETVELGARATASESPDFLEPVASAEVRPPVVATIEARLAAARTGSLGAQRGPVPTASPAAAGPAQGIAQRDGVAAPPPPRAFVPPPPIGSRTIIPLDAPAQTPATSGAPARPALAASALATAPRATTLQALSDPVTLLRSLKLSITASNIAAAKLAIATPARLPNALATLERALPAGDDPRVATLRTLTAFVGKIEPASPQLAAQIAAYVEHVVDGSEPKIATLLAAREAAAPTAPPTAITPTSTPPAALAAGAPDHVSRSTNLAEPPLPVIAQAIAVGREAALGHDLKTQLLDIASAPPISRAPEEVAAAVASAITALTSAQISAVQTLAANPSTIAFAVPVWLGSGYAQAHVQIDRRDESAPNVPLDGDNFHIAFVLETKHVGVVTVDIKTVGRSVTVAVRTEATPAAERFASALSQLTDRLEGLRYRVASADAAVARAAEAEPIAVAVAPDSAGVPTNVNIHA